ncbi:MAG: hypothetical protein MZW92_61450 [Comamonadaceae bacterium]|nr:hypothetical protein [Comamonadaceae bacterium]
MPNRSTRTTDDRGRDRTEAAAGPREPKAIPAPRPRAAGRSRTSSSVVDERRREPDQRDERPEAAVRGPGQHGPRVRHPAADG